MRSIFVLAFVVAAVLAEPPRRRFNFRAFARQEVEDNGSGNGDTEEVKPQGYEYTPPAEAEQLKLPARFTFNKFARQEQQQPTNGGYSYPKPTYGTPETTDEPSTEYGTPATDESSTEESTDDPAPATDSEIQRLKSVQASQLRLRSGKFASPQKLVRARIQQQQQQFVQVQQQPIIYVDYPSVSDLVEPQYVYIFK
jgi:hypothetical protein